MARIKSLVRIIIDWLYWPIAMGMVSVIGKRAAPSRRALVLPAGDLDGGFGEDIMVAALLNAIDFPEITILTGARIPRPDYLGNDTRVIYKGGLRFGAYFFLLRHLAEHSHVFVIGADILDGAYGRMNALCRLRMMRMAHKMGRTSTLLAFSISNSIPAYVRHNLRKIGQIQPIPVRDEETFKRLSDIVPTEQIQLCSDIAFICPTPQSVHSDEHMYENWVERQRSDGRAIIAVCPNALQARKLGLKEYVEKFSSLLMKFTRYGNFSFVMLYHDCRPQCQGHSDREIAYELSKASSVKGLVFFSPAIHNGVDVKRYLKRADFSVTGRMHLGISGITLGLPMFGICYQNKFEGLQALCGVDPQRSLVDYSHMERAEEVIPIFLRELPKNRERIRESLAIVQQMAHAYLFQDFPAK